MTAATPSPAPAPRSEVFLSVEKGTANPEELAAVTAVLLARSKAGVSSPPPKSATAVGWSRPERSLGYRPPHSWQN
ncbi:acyl-CoA carboxylase subunit epsilon [Streptomyces sp. NBC_01754]|uniref:acyl-CoA carboxylase subunit epsilon n=1 Tax=Streptomyces sp. NBC_01754 TaxID=2975930 RepID=UPI002DD86611|nr:acyl-CoA carboxylase subunit epsilon [Streptomyces sp. NBC_01754]WSC94323.1 acyl-CoA carboxylase subunit epsilon [Streptomyces sp. NBC_01754]